MLLLLGTSSSPFSRTTSPGSSDRYAVIALDLDLSKPFPNFICPMNGSPTEFISSPFSSSTGGIEGERRGF
jgi:hypothetical protein